jgi:hypothetical protein
MIFNEVIIDSTTMKVYRHEGEQKEAKGIAMEVSTLRRLLLTKGLWERKRRECFEELIPFDKESSPVV